MDVIVGRACTQTPVFADEMTHLIFRPYWNVPRSILVNEVLPAIKERDPATTRHDMGWFPGADGGARIRRHGQRERTRSGTGEIHLPQRRRRRTCTGTPARAVPRSRRDSSAALRRVADPPALA